MNYLIGVDLGTSVVTTALFDQHKNQLYKRDMMAPLLSSGEGKSFQDGEEFLTITLDAINKIMTQSKVKAKDIAVISLDGQMAGAIGVGDERRAITPWYPSALDNRYVPYAKMMKERVGHRLYRLNGALPFTAPRILWWKHEYPEIYGKIKKVMTLAGYVGSRLADLSLEESYIDPSYLAWHGLSDAKSWKWSNELIHCFELDKEMLPEIVSADSIVGYLSKEAASRSGLISGIPIAAGAGDQAASFVGAGITCSGQLIDISGTFPIFSTCVDKYFTDEKNEILSTIANPFSKKLWHPLMYVNAGGLSHKWSGEQFYPELPLKERYNKLDWQAETVPPGSNGLLFVPHFIGRGCPPDPNCRGAWIGLTLEHRQPHLYRAVLESIAYEYAHALEVIKTYYPDIEMKEVRVCGGGSRSRVWNQIKSQVLGIPYFELSQNNFATLGCILIGGKAIKLFEDVSQVLPVSSKNFIKVDEKIHIKYQGYLQAYREAIKQLSSTHELLAHLRSN